MSEAATTQAPLLLTCLAIVPRPANPHPSAPVTAAAGDLAGFPSPRRLRRPDRSGQ